MPKYKKKKKTTREQLIAVIKLDVIRYLIRGVETNAKVQEEDH